MKLSHNRFNTFMSSSYRRHCDMEFLQVGSLNFAIACGPWVAGLTSMLQIVILNFILVSALIFQLYNFSAFWLLFVDDLLQWLLKLMQVLQQDLTASLFLSLTTLIFDFTLKSAFFFKVLSSNNGCFKFFFFISANLLQQRFRSSMHICVMQNFSFSLYCFGHNFS